MNIPIENISKGIARGLSVEEYICLLCKFDGCEYLFPTGIFKNSEFSLADKKYLSHVNYEITNTGRRFIEEINGVMSSKIDNKYELLHKKLQTELLTLTQKRQKNLQGKYPFLPNNKDLTTRLSKIIKKYKLDDWNRVEKLLIDYIYTCHKANWQFTPTLEYYIEKNSSSKLVTDYENFEEKEVEKKLEKEELQPKEIKDLF